MRFVELLKLADVNNVTTIFIRQFKHLPRKRRIRSKARNRVKKVVDFILNCQVEFSDELVICLEDVNDDAEKLHYTDVYGLDLKTNTKYGLEINPWQKTAGYLVDEASINKYGIDKLAALVLWEMTYFGYDNHLIQKEVEGWHRPTFEKWKN